MLSIKIKNSLIIFPLLSTIGLSCKNNDTKTDTDTNTNENNKKVEEVEETIVNESITIVDSTNREVSLNPSEVKKVVCVGAGALRLYSYVGDLNLLSGIEDIDRSVAGANPFANASRPYYDVNKDLFSKLPSCGKGGPMNQAPEFERILSCNPDVIISEYNDKSVVENIENQTKKKVVAVSYGNNSVFDDNVSKSLKIIGKICNKNKKAELLVDYINKSKEELSNIGKNNSSEDKFYVGCLGNWGKQSILSTSANFPLFNISNLTNAVSVSGVTINNGKVKEESLSVINPTRMFIDAAGVDLLKTDYGNNTNNIKSILDNLDAVKNNQVYLQMPFNAYYTNLEIALMDAYYISSIAYPNAYTNFDIKNKSDEITEKFLGVKCYDQIASKPTSHSGFKNIGKLSEFLSE